MKQPDNPKLRFPKDFLWGAATSAHQVEGNTHNQWTVWELENARELSKTAPKEQSWLPDWQSDVKPYATDPDNYVSGLAADHYNRYKEDFDLLKSFNMNTFRFGIEWARVEPEEGKWDAKEIDHYRRYIAELKSRGIEPLLTLFHYTIPVWFADKGGFEKRRNVKYFVRFAEKVLQEVAGDVTYVCTINEPEVYAVEGWYLGTRPPQKHNAMQFGWVYFNLAYAHNQVVKRARKLGLPHKFSVSKNCAHHYAGDDKFLSKASATVAEWGADHLFLMYIRRHMDWLGLNFYFSNRYIGMEWKNENKKVSDLGFQLIPKDLQFVIERLYKKYKLPIIVTENGVADHTDQYRKWWIQETLLAIHKAMANGADVKGYLHWSLLDNFEWSFGKWPRFGLVHIDYKTLKRTPRGSAIWFGKLIKQLRDAS